MLIAIGRQLLLYIPLMIILPNIFGISSIYYGSFVIDFLLAVITVILIRNEFKELRNAKAI